MRGSLRPFLIKLGIFAVFTISVTAMLAAVIGNIQPFTDFYPVKAEFSDATGLLKADLVKVAGVNVGKVTGAEVRGDKALVTMAIRKDVRLPNNVHAAIRYRNLIGVRMVVLTRDPQQPDAPPLAENTVIPISRTSPALDLGVIFNNLKPVLASLSPEDANIVSRAVIKVFSGREVRLQQMVADLADLAQTLGDKGPVAANLIRDLNSVAVNLAEHDQELQRILVSFDQVLGTLAGRSTELARAAENLGVSSNGLADLIEGNRPALDTTIKQLTDLLAIVAKRKDELDRTLVGLAGPRGAVHGLSRATTYGEWANLNVVCVDGSGCPARPAAATAAGLRSIFEDATR